MADDTDDGISTGALAGGVAAGAVAAPVAAGYGVAHLQRGFTKDLKRAFDKGAAADLTTAEGKAALSKSIEETHAIGQRLATFTTEAADAGFMKKMGLIWKQGVKSKAAMIAIPLVTAVAVGSIIHSSNKRQSYVERLEAERAQNQSRGAQVG